MEPGLRMLPEELTFIELGDIGPLAALRLVNVHRVSVPDRVRPAPFRRGLSQAGPVSFSYVTIRRQRLSPQREHAHNSPTVKIIQSDGLANRLDFVN